MTFDLVSLKSLQPDGFLSWCLWLVSVGLLSVGLLQDVRIGVIRWMRNATRRMITSSFSTKNSHISTSILGGQKDKNGMAKLAAMVIFIPCLAFIVIGSVAIPAERLVVQNQTTVIRDLYLPHVPEDMDQLHFYVDPQHDATRRTLLVLCRDGLTPKWDEGQTIAWVKVHVEPNCLQLLGYDGVRDVKHNIINDGGE